MSRKTVKVTAPATVGNVAIGLHHLAFALDEPSDDVLIREGVEPGLRISKITGDKKRLSWDVKVNSAALAARSFLEAIGGLEVPLEMEIRKRIPVEAGLGGDAPIAAAAVFALSKFFKTGHSKRELLRFVCARWAEEVDCIDVKDAAASLIGGMMLVRDRESIDICRVHVPVGMRVLVILPSGEEEYERVDWHHHNVDLETAAQQAANAGAFFTAMFNSDFGLIKRSFKDLLLEPIAKRGITLYDEVREIAYNEDIFGFNICGGGPAMFALCENSKAVDFIKEKVERLCSDRKKGVRFYEGMVNHDGALLC